MNRLISSVLTRPTITSFVRSSIANLSSSTIFRPVTHCIFDLDGLILDTEHIYEMSVRNICKSFGKEYPWDVRIKVMGTTEQRSAEIVINDLDLPINIQQFLHMQEEICRREFVKLNVLSGADRLIYHLYKKNVPFCLATSSGKEMAELKMSSHPKMFKLFHHKVMGSTDPEVKVGKPAPDIFLIAAKRFRDQPHPNQCLVFEDSPNGVQAAISAGMQSVMVPDKIVEPEKRKGATVVLESLNDFKPEMFGLPAFKN